MRNARMDLLPLAALGLLLGHPGSVGASQYADPAFLELPFEIELDLHFGPLPDRAEERASWLADPTTARRMEGDSSICCVTGGAA